MAELHDVPPPGTGPPDKRESEGGGLPVKLLLLGLVGVYLFLFIILNADQVSVSFVFFSAEISLIVGFALVAVLGFIAGYMANELRDRRRRKTAQPKT